MRKIVSIVFTVLLSVVLVSCVDPDPIVTQYDVNFYADDVLIKSERVIEGEAATAPDVPEKEGYTFTEWDKEFNNVMSNLIVNAIFEIKTYTVTFKDGDTVLKTETVNHGEGVTAPTVENLPGKIFKGWDKEITNVTSNLTVQAVYEVITYEVKFYVDDTLLDTVDVEHGKSASAPVPPTVPGYTFVGWDKEFNNVMSNLIVKAIFEIKTYTVTFKVGDTVVKTETVNHGESVTAPTVENLPGKIFKGWDKEITNVTSNLTVQAVYENILYTVTFMDGETVLEAQEVEHGDDALAPEEPIKVGYTFVGWDKEFTNVTSNLTVKAIYENSLYTVTFMDGETVLDVQEVEHGDDALAPEEPIKVGYTFVGWDKEITNVTSNLTVQAVYEVIIYEVKFYVDDTLLDTVDVEHGKSASAPVPPTVPGYHFVEWSIDFSNVTSNIDVYAVYIENDPIVSIVNNLDDINEWAGSSTISENVLIKQGVFGLQFRIKSMNDGVEYRTAVDGSQLQGDSLVFYVKGDSKIQLFVRFYYEDYSNTQFMINPTIEGGIVEIPLSSFPGLNLADVTHFGFFAQEWSVAYQWMFIEIDNVAIVDEKGLAKYYEDNSYNPYVALLGSTSDTNLWTVTGGLDPLVELHEDGINLVYRTDYNGSEFIVDVTQDELRGETLMFVMSGLPGAEIFVRFYRGDGSFEQIMINGNASSKIIELPLSLFNNIDMTSVTKFGFFIQYWGADLYTNSSIFVKDIAIVDYLGRLEYLATHETPEEPNPDVSLSANDNASNWSTFNANNLEFAVVENGVDGLVFKFVSSSDGSEYKIAVNGTELSGNTVSFYAKGNPSSEIFVRFFYEDGSYVHVMVNPSTEGGIIEISLDQFVDLNLSAVSHFGFFIQDWTTSFGWQDIAMKDMKLITK